MASLIYAVNSSSVYKAQDQSCFSSILRPLLEHVLKQFWNNKFQESQGCLNAHMCIHSEFTEKFVVLDCLIELTRQEKMWCCRGHAVVYTYVCTELSVLKAKQTNKQKNFGSIWSPWLQLQFPLSHPATSTAFPHLSFIGLEK